MIVGDRKNTKDARESPRRFVVIVDGQFVHKTPNVEIDQLRISQYEGIDVRARKVVGLQ